MHFPFVNTHYTIINKLKIVHFVNEIFAITFQSNWIYDFTMVDHKGEHDFTKCNMCLEQHSNQPIRLEGHVYSLCKHLVWVVQHQCYSPIIPYDFRGRL